MLDIDAGSPYHPRRDRMAIDRIVDALAPLGLEEHLTVTSSDSKGLHLYFPFDIDLPSWKVGLAITTLLENRGFKCLGGWLEVFPNPKPFTSNGSISLYHGHRLPMQQGSYLLNQDLCPITGGAQTFARLWQATERRNSIDKTILEQTIAQSKRTVYRISTSAEKFLNDMNADIEPGWTGKGQTNELLGGIARRSYIFGHILGASEPLTGEDLVADIVKVAKGLPGFKDWCGHQHDLESRAQDWARCVEASHYYHYGNNTPLKVLNPKVKQLTLWNQQQLDKARVKIKEAVLGLFRANSWPETIKERVALLLKNGMSKATLYKHKDLWHPSAEGAKTAPVENPPDPPIFQEGAGDGEATPASPTSLLGEIGCTSSNGNNLSGEDTKEIKNAGCTLNGHQQQPGDRQHPFHLTLPIKQALAAQQTARKAKEQAQRESRQRQQRDKAPDPAYIAYLRALQATGEPILVKEATGILERLGLSPG